ncbi:hypothetical protein [Staphylococcus hominis]|uniref:hypothetical protein n=1 Tax=Staphylococcus hominis TaxID=1290 RepID=UPI0006B94928|nr:hypothetical protein [Staphylococcus hominis]KPG91070.1 hypothetical protein AEQ58_02600 [Staphylococcus hominis]
MNIKFEELVNFKYKYIFEYYDMPLFFILESPSNELYLNYMIDEIDNNIYKWFFSRITKFELNDLLNQNIGVKYFLLQLINEKRMNYLITNNSIEELDFKLVKEIKIKELPIEDYTVEYDFVRNKTIEEKESNIKIKSNEFDLVFRDENNSHLIEANVLVNILGKVQNLYTTVSQGFSTLKVEAIYPSSFGMKLVGEDNLINTPEKTLESILTLFKNVKELDFDKIEENLNIDKLYDLQAINKAKQLVKEVNKYNISLEIKPQKDDDHKYFIGKSDKIKFEELKSFIERINPEKNTVITVRGTLNSINMNYNKFTIIDDENNKFSGKIDGKLKKDITNKHFVIPARIEADLDKLEKYDTKENRYVTKYIMKNYRQTIEEN